MTLPDSMKKSSNFTATLAVALGCASFTAASVMHFWQSPLDYWLLWAAIATGLGTIFLSIAAIIFRLIFIEAMRSN